MLFPEEHASHLKKWIVKRLENTSDADADVLADYVLALLGHDGDINDVRRLCETEIADYLKEDAPVFVNDVFRAIAHKSYLPGAPPPPTALAATVAAQPPLPLGGLPYDDLPLAQATQPPIYSNGSKKRSYNDRGDVADTNGGDSRFGPRAYKQVRRGTGHDFANGGRGRGGRAQDANSGFRGGAPLPPGFAQLPPGFPPIPPPGGLFDPNDLNHAMNAMFEGLQPMRMATSPVLNFSSQARGPPLGQQRRRRCRDYDTKGYCARGNTCMFEHGDDSIYVPPSLPAYGAQALPQPPANDEYDPTNALMPGMFNGPTALQTQQPPFPHDGGFQPRGRGGRQHQNSPRKVRGKAPFSADGPVHDRTKSTIVVENIPEENFDEEQVKGFFSQFGNIVEVSMQPYKRLAVVKFDSWGAANAAWKSPKVVFDNRFVKIFWYKEEDALLPGLLPANGGATSSQKKTVSTAENSTPGEGSPAPPEIDMEEFLRRQEEAQKVHEEKAKKLEEVERQRQELEKRQKELLAKQREERAKLEARLAKKANGAEGQAENKPEGENGSSNPPKSVSQSEALRAQLAALEAEAKQLGLDPDAMEEHDTSAWNPRGGGYVPRGRGGYVPRARGYAPRGMRGAYRGRGSNHAAYAAYSLDNRPKKITLSGVDFTVPEKDETLRQYLFGIGEFAEIHTTPTATDITFKDRKTAEKFFNSIVSNDKEITGIEGHVEPSWSGGGSAPSSRPATATGHANSYSHMAAAAKRQQQQQPQPTDDNVAMTGVGTESDKDVSIVLEHPPAQQHGNHHHAAAEMDYDVADENQWDID
ncbi:hypothetical protein B0T22DRAFT_156913 [Podospora appendiculata]|uniref:RNA-binding protein n=1 Tax=Podospora appendiculata TaxID=314037 RepID=A0AAE0X9M9_9PEZI|nr:hypothetical protein B0T22DRAFT_156913 [Podospora appendiculata]